MVNSTSEHGGQDPPQGSGRVAANTTNVSTSMTESQAIPTSTGSTAVSSSQIMLVSTSMTMSTWTMPTISSTTTPPFVSTTEIPSSTQAALFSTNFTSQVPPFTPRPTGFKGFRPLREQPYGMPSSYMIGFQSGAPTYTQPATATFSPNAGSIGRSAQNQGPSNQMPTLITNNQATFRQ
ncbi:uncharacterized protein LOC131597248 [Vicia villosa]|uniref:uncharacterized protein LOC131597248 n=1 Tax=Vicia villosa TaxID=3911 RepID=UPI00273B1817|nr:uncharacterized protein LOC131597248 [Vicia villosa]